LPSIRYGESAYPDFRQLLSRRFLSLIAGLLFAWSAYAPAATGDAPAGSVTAMGIEPRVTRLVVRFRSGSDAPDSGSIRGALLDEVRASLGHAMSATPSTSARNHILRLTQPVNLREARRLVGVLRMRHDVVYAELDSGENGPDVARTTSATRGGGAPTIRRLLVTFAEPGLAAKSRNTEKLDAEWDQKLSAAAGVPLRVARATIGGAWVVELFAAVDVATAETLAARLQTHGVARLVAPDYTLAPILVPNDPAFVRGDQWNLLGALGAQNYSLDAQRAWDITTGSSSTVIALIDTGILPHPDLANRILPGYNFISDPLSAGNGVGRSDDATDLRWTALAMYPDPTDPGTPPSRHGGRRGGEPRATDARAAKVALERISIPQDTIDRIREVASPGSAVIVSDEALSNETGKGTDFVVLMSGEPQGGIKIRKRNNDAPSAWRRDRDPYGDYGYRRPYYQRSSPYYSGGSGPFGWW
jgi:hypothetical protein